MTVDLLRSAAGALRETGDTALALRSDRDSDGDGTLARVMHTVRRRKRRRRLAGALVLQLAFAMAAAGVWAATTGRLSAVWHRLGRQPPSPSLRQPPARHQAVKPGPQWEPIGRPASPAAAPAPPPAVSPAPAVVRSARPIEHRVARSAPPPSATLADDIYQQAHQAHFVRRDFAAALSGWDRYLALPSPPRFAVEARYNRAIALLRLGRRSEAADALRPFSSGDYGAYRRSEARALIEAIAAGP